MLSGKIDRRVVVFEISSLSDHIRNRNTRIIYLLTLLGGCWQPEKSKVEWSEAVKCCAGEIRKVWTIFL